MATERQITQAAYSALEAIFETLPKEAHTVVEMRCVLERASDYLNYLRLEYEPRPKDTCE